MAATTVTLEWEQHIDNETQTSYYYNTRTGESAWEKPEGFVDALSDESTPASSNAATAQRESANPPMWRRYTDDSNGKPYYYDKANDVTQWEEPEGDVEDASDDEEDNQEDKVKDDDHISARDNDADQSKEKYATPAHEEREESRPESMAASEKDAPPPTRSWVKHVDKATGKPYFHDTISNTTQWEAPEHYTEASEPTAMSAEYLEYLHRTRAEKLARATQRVLDPEGNLSRLDALLNKIGDAGVGGTAAHVADAVDAPQDIEQSLRDRARAEWQQHVDPHTQKYYYHNIVTGETQWHKPDGPIVSALADWIPPDTSTPDPTSVPARTVSGHHYAATAKFNRVSGRFEKLGGEEYFENRGVATDRAGRQMSHFFDVQQLEKNREDAKRIKEDLKRKNVDWKKMAAEKKARKQKRQNEWIYQD